MLRSTSLSLALAVAMWPVSGAQAQEFSQAPLKYFTVENVTAVLNKLGAQGVTAAKDQDGEMVVRFQSGDVKYSAFITACKNQPGCLGLLLGVPVLLEGGTFSHDVVNGFNEALPFAKAARTNDGKTVVLFRYIIADGGILEANMASNIAVFSALPGAFAKYLSRQVVASLDQARPMQMSVVASPGTETPGALKLPVAAGTHEDVAPLIKRFAKEAPYKLPY